jgi:hypothetical protein
MKKHEKLGALLAVSLRLLNVPLRAAAWLVPMAKCAGRSHFLVGYSMLRNRSAMRWSI